MMPTVAPQYEGMLSAHLEQLYSTELPHLYSFLSRLGARGSEIEDMAHDVFVTAMRRWKSFDTSKPVRPWLLGIAFRVMVEMRRKSASTREVLGAPLEATSERPGAEAHVEQREARELIDEALESLDPERRAVFVMYELEGVSAADISVALDTPVPTTYSRLRVAREEFTAAVRRIQLRRGEP